MIYNFESPFVFHTYVQNHNTVQPFILTQVENAIKNNEFQIAPGKAKSSYGIHQKNVLTPQMEHDVIWNPFKLLTMEKSFNVLPQNAELTSIWWNHYSPGDYARPHNHTRSDFSGVYIVLMNEMNKTMFHSFGTSYNLPWNTETFVANKITEGQVMIFPSSLIHSVEPCEQERVIVSFNLSVTGLRKV